MKIFYHEATKSWSHEQDGFVLTFGANQVNIPYHQNQLTSDVSSFEVEPFHSHEILTVGILTTVNSKNEIGIGGNLPLFQSLHLYLLKHGIFSYVFTTEDALNEQNSGYIYSSHSSKWEKIHVPLPHIVYNRIPLRSYESLLPFQQLKTKLTKHKILMFNPCFIDKYEMYSTFKQHKKLKQLLPQTIMVTHFHTFTSFFHTHKNIYLKPREGNRGNGIYTLTQKQDGSLQLESPTHVECYPDLEAYWNMYKEQLQAKKYVAQQAITPKKKNGHRYDYRLLVHYENGLFKLSGKAVRMSQTQEITTHVPRGGKLYPYHEVTTQALDQQLADIAQTCGIVLSKQLGFIGEFSIDLGENEAGKLFIYEVNSKPMQFDEADIEANRLFQLKNLFIELKYPKEKRNRPV
jgi:glutathione synthase/RimK-type ligase-like ATP-grasp enzyme